MPEPSSSFNSKSFGNPGVANDAQQQSTNNPQNPAEYILFDTIKGEKYTSENGFRRWARRYRRRWEIVGSTGYNLNEAELRSIKLLVLAAPQKKFGMKELNAIKMHLEGGGSLLVLAHEGGEPQLGTNFNYLLEEYGMSIVADGVIRNTFYKYHMPKEALIQDGFYSEVLKPVQEKAAATVGGRRTPKVNTAENTGGDHNATVIPRKLDFVYPYGATILVKKPARSFLGTGLACYPINRSIGAIYDGSSAVNQQLQAQSRPMSLQQRQQQQQQAETPARKGKVVVLGSHLLFHDNYIDKEDNGKLLDLIMEFLMTDKFTINRTLSAEHEVAEYQEIADIAALAEKPKICLQESDELPNDLRDLIRRDVFYARYDMIPYLNQVREELNIPRGPLELITPGFEAALPKLQPAVFEPQFIDMDEPPLELFDLDADLSDDSVKLAETANRCTDADLTFFVRECALITGLSQKIPEVSQRDPKLILEYLMMQLIEYKSSTFDPNNMMLPHQSSLELADGSDTQLLFKKSEAGSSNAKPR